MTLMATQLSPKRVHEQPTIPDRLYFKIGDVARICKVETYVLRFWESQFPQLKPGKSGSGQRLYRRRDVETAMRIKSLLYNEGYTIPGARQVFKSELKQREPQLALAIDDAQASVNPRQLKKLQKDLHDLLALLGAQSTGFCSITPMPRVDALRRG